MLTQALRKVGIDDPHEIAQERMEQLVEIPKDIQAKLLPPLLEAMSDVIDGVGSAKHDLAQALFEIREAGTETERNKQYGREAYEKLNALPHEDKINLMAHVDDLKSSVNMRFMQTSLRNMANIAVLVTIDEYYKDCLAGNVDAMLKKSRLSTKTASPSLPTSSTDILGYHPSSKIWLDAMLRRRHFFRSSMI
jgi:hypothetical protein